MNTVTQLDLLTLLIRESLEIDFLLSEGYVTLENEQALMDRAEQLYFEIQNNTESLLSIVTQKTRNGKFIYNQKNPYIQYPNYFTVNSKNDQFTVNVGFFINDPEEKFPAKGKTVVKLNGITNLGINLNFALKNDVNRFQKLIYHELIHAQDPLARKPKIGNFYQKNLERKLLNLKPILSPDAYKEKAKDSYYNSTHEFTAYVGDLLYDLRFRTQGDLEKLSVMKDILFLLIKLPARQKYKISLLERDLVLRAIELGIFSSLKEYWKYSEDFMNKVSFWSKDHKNLKKLKKYLGTSIFNLTNIT